MSCVTDRWDHAERGIIGNQGKIAKKQSGKITFFVIFRSEFHFREGTVTANRETPFLYLPAFLSRLS